MNKILRMKQKNVNQKILEKLIDVESRIIMFSIVRKAKTAEEITWDEHLPQSSIYARLRDLEKLNLVFIEKTKTTDAGRTLKFYRSKIKDATIKIMSVEPKFSLTPTN